MKLSSTILNSILFSLLFSCGVSPDKGKKEQNFVKGTYGYDLRFLQKYLKPIELKDEFAAVLIAPQYQGRVMTSTSSGLNGFSYGWINHDLIASGKVQPHINAYGGEERLWLGPEGGQFSIFFAQGVPFDVEHWQTPSSLDTEEFDVVSVKSREAVFNKKIKLTNYAGFIFDLEVTRKVTLLKSSEVATGLNQELPNGVRVVAFETDNRIKNSSPRAWMPETGALSIWLLGMMNPSPEVTIVLPYKKGDFGTIVKDDYFGKVPAERLIIADNVIFFKADGKLRSKIGLSPKRALPVIGSYDAANKILTIVETTIDPTAAEYVNSSWKIQKDPFAGDVINSYNDGPMADGSQMGPFYELESSSKAAFLKPGESLGHIQRTFHFGGDEKALSEISVKKLGVTIDEIKKVFQPK